MRLDELPISFLRGVAIPFGLIWGSFLNVVIYRVPLEMSVVHPPSHCPGCGKPVKAYDNVPVLSYLWLRGRARCCGTKMSPRYPLVELLGGLLSLAVLEVFVRSLPGGTSALTAVALYLVYFALALGLLAAAFIDAEHMFLPDSITLGGTALGLATAGLRHMGYAESVLSAGLGFLGVWLPFILLYKAVRGRAGMGLGDAKLLALAGAWLGLPGVLFVLFGGATQGSIAALVVYLVRGKIDEPEAIQKDRAELEQLAKDGDTDAAALLAEDPAFASNDEGVGKARIPFGPFLILAIYEFMFFGERIVAWFEAAMTPS